MEGGYSQGGGPPPHMMGYFPGMPGYNMPQGPMSSNPPQANNNPRSSNTISIWAGDLDAYMDETFLRQAVTASGWGADITRIKVVRDHYSGMHAGYGFLDAASPEAAQRVIATGSGMPIPGTNRCWRLNMGRNAAVNSGNNNNNNPGSNNPGANNGPSSGGGGGAGGGGSGSESSIYVGNLEPTVTDYQLMTAFRPRYTSVRHAKVVCNEYGQSRGFGFVRFANPQDAERAVTEMQGFVFNQKPIRLSPAAGRNRNNQMGHGGPHGGGHRGGPMHNYGHGPPHGGPPTNKRPRQLMSPDDPNNTTIFIGGTANHVTEELLWREFSSFGELEAVRVPVNKTGFAFVRFKSRECAQRAKDEVSGTPFASLNPNRPVRIEWASEQIPILKPGPPPGVTSGSYGAGAGGAAQPFEAQYSQYGDNNGNDGGSNATNGAQNGYPGNYAGNQGDGSGAGGNNKNNIGNKNDGGDGTGGKGDGKNGKDGGSGLKGDDGSGGGGNKHLGDGGNHNSGGETEPPSKRAAVGRPEYSGNQSEAPNKGERGGDAKGDGGTEDSPGMQFSWLNASSSQPNSNGQ